MFVLKTKNKIKIHLMKGRRREERQMNSEERNIRTTDYSGRKD